MKKALAFVLLIENIDKFHKECMTGKLNAHEKSWALLVKHLHSKVVDNLNQRMKNIRVIAHVFLLQNLKTQLTKI